MSIKKSNYSKISHAHHHVLEQMKSLENTLHLPKDLKKMIKSFQKQIADYDMEQHREDLISVSNPFLSDKALLDIVVDTTGYNKWSIETDEEDESEYYARWAKSQFNLDVTKEQVRSVKIARHTNSRNDVFLISFRLFPGYVYVSFDTGRAGFGPEELIKNEDLHAVMQKQVDIHF